MSESLVRCRLCRSVYVAEHGCDECAWRQEQDNAERAARLRLDRDPALNPGPASLTERQAWEETARRQRLTEED